MTVVSLEMSDEPKKSTIMAKNTLIDIIKGIPRKLGGGKSKVMHSFATNNARLHDFIGFCPPT